MEPLTDEQIQQARDEIRTNGLPQDVIDLYTRSGMGYLLENKTQRILDLNPEVYRNPKNYSRLIEVQAVFLAYESKDYISKIAKTRIENKGIISTTASSADLAYLEDLRSQVNQSINQGIATSETKALIDEMVRKSQEVLDGTNNLAYLPYYEFAVNALAVLPALDNTPPEITITTPVNGTSYTLNQNVLANWQASDPGSGIVSVSATVPDGTVINTAIVGMKNFTVNATDNSGNQVSKTVVYNVVDSSTHSYNYSGLLAPFKGNNKTSELGSTVPVKFQLRDEAGNYVSTAKASVYLVNASGAERNGTSAGKSNQGNLFRYDAKSNQYIFSLATKTLTAGTWQIRIELDDGTNKYATMVLKKHKDKDKKDDKEKKEKKEKEDNRREDRD
jgi:hypothetical protein